MKTADTNKTRNKNLTILNYKHQVFEKNSKIEKNGRKIGGRNKIIQKSRISERLRMTIK